MAKKRVQEIDYYREPLNEYSPLIQAKLMGRDIQDKDVITAMVLYLKEKNIAVINDDNKLVINKEYDLKKHEKFFVDDMGFIFGDLYNHTKTKYNDHYSVIQYLDLLVTEDLIDEELLQQRIYNIGDISINLYVNLVDVLSFFFIMMNMIFYSNFLSVTTPLSLKVVKIFFYFSSAIWILIYVIDIFFKISFNALKTEKGLEYIEKLKGQKRFLKKFSLISNKTVKHVSLWESYIRVAIFFNLKGKLDEDANNFYKNVIKTYGYNYRQISVVMEKLYHLIWYIIIFLVWFFFINLLHITDDSDIGYTIVLFNFVVLIPLYFIIIGKLSRI